MQNGQLNVIKGDRHSVGYHRSKADYVFTESVIPLKTPTSFYLTTDGMLDQTGGEQGFMFGKTRFSHLISELDSLPMEAHPQRLKSALQAYQGKEMQNDDVTVVSFRL
jgi:serine phosphatase RsbU (regulator of sigma subunit)